VWEDEIWLFNFRYWSINRGSSVPEERSYWRSERRGTGWPWRKWILWKRHIYNRGGSKYNEYITSIAVCDEMEVRYNLSILFIQSDTGSLHWKIALGIYLQHSCRSFRFLFMLLVGVCDLFHSVSFCCPRYLGRSRRESRISKLCSCDLNVTSQSHRTALVSQLSPFPTRVSPGFGKAIDI